VRQRLCGPDGPSAMGARKCPLAPRPLRSLSAPTPSQNPGLKTESLSLALFHPREHCRARGVLQSCRTWRNSRRSIGTSDVQLPASSFRNSIDTRCQLNFLVTYSKQTTATHVNRHTFRIGLPASKASRAWEISTGERPNPHAKLRMKEISPENKTGGECQRHPPPGVGGVCCRYPVRDFGVPAPGRLGKPAFSRCHVSLILITLPEWVSTPILISELLSGDIDRVSLELFAPDRAANTVFAAPANSPAAPFAAW
jgi:hypothetical protein